MPISVPGEDNPKGGRTVGSEQKSGKMSSKTRVILALCVIFAGIALIAAAFWFSLRWLFYENPRLVIRELQLECTSGYWAGKTEQERSVKAQEFAKRIGIVLGETNLFAVDLRRLRDTIRRDQPEIEHISIRRELPDLLVFQIQNRVPRADTGFGYFLDDDGVALRPSYYTSDRRTGLPVVYSENLRRELSLTSKGKTTDPEIGVALAFIRMVVTSEDPCISRITIRKIIVIRNPDVRYLQCELTYRDDPKPYRVLLPAGVSGEQLRRSVAERLIPVLNSMQNTSSGRMIDLRFEGPVFAPR